MYKQRKATPDGRVVQYTCSKCGRVTDVSGRCDSRSLRCLYCGDHLAFGERHDRLKRTCDVKFTHMGNIHMHITSGHKDASILPVADDSGKVMHWKIAGDYSTSAEYASKYEAFTDLVAIASLSNTMEICHDFALVPMRERIHMDGEYCHLRQGDERTKYAVNFDYFNGSEMGDGYQKLFGYGLPTEVLTATANPV